MIPGKGNSGIPYIHIKDVIQNFKRCIFLHDKLENCETFMVSQSETVIHTDLFKSIKQSLDPQRSVNPIYLSTQLASLGLHLKMKFASLTGRTPFEQPWMLNYTDRPWVVNNDYTQSRLNWPTNSELHILKRLPVIINFYKNYKNIWIERNLRRGAGKYIYQSD